jgi:hypothetical protein
MEAKPSSSAAKSPSSADKSPSSEDKSSFWKDKSPWKPNPSSWMVTPSSSAAKPSSSAAKSNNYSLPAGFPDIIQFEKCYGPPLPGMKPQNFIRIDIVLCVGTSFIISSGRIMPGCRRNSYFFVVFCDAGTEHDLEEYDGRMKTFSQDPHDPAMVFGYLKDGIINLDLARERLSQTILDRFLLRLGLPTSS